MKARELKLWNGRCYCVLPGSKWKKNGETGHVYVAAYSMADARRVCVEAGLFDPGATEVSKYWNAGAWGNSMDGITPERGVWLQYGYSGQPVRIQPIKDKGGCDGG